MTDFKLNTSGDLELTPTGDICMTESIRQAVQVRLRWFLHEWRLGPDMGFPYFEEVFVKNPSQSIIRHRIRETVLSVDGVTDVKEISFTINTRTREATIAVTFSTDEETFREEVEIKWQHTA